MGLISSKNTTPSNVLNSLCCRSKNTVLEMPQTTLVDIQQTRVQDPYHKPIKSSLSAKNIESQSHLPNTCKLLRKNGSPHESLIDYQDIQPVDFCSITTKSNWLAESTTLQDGKEKVGQLECRIPLEKPLDQIVETISNTMLDESKESYGQDNTCKSRPILGVEDLTYQYSEISFEPNGCIWKGKVTYCCTQTKESVTRKGTTIKLCVENVFDFLVQCHTIKKKSDLHVTNDESDMLDHYAIDIWSEVDCSMSKDARRAISVTLEHIEYDIARGLYYLYLPEFPEGCGQSPFHSIYQLDEQLLSGTYGIVCQGTHRESKKQVAIKCIEKMQLEPGLDVSIFREVKILSSLNHKHICPILDFFMEDDCYYIVMELMEGGDVFNRIGNFKRYNEEIARSLCKNLLEAIAYCHTRNIAHCDLKPNNFLLKSKIDDSSVMLADFGFADYVFAPNTLSRNCGTPFFVAPEVVRSEPHDERADMWSVGVAIYCILSGKLPFTATRSIDLFKVILNGTFDFDDEAWENVSDEAKDLICDLLVIDPSERLTASEALQSKWISQMRNRQLRLSYLGKSQKNIKTFNAHVKLKTAMLTVQSMIRWKMVGKRSKENMQ